MSFSTKFSSILATVSKYNDIFLALVVVAVIMLMIVPIPTFLFDLLLALNLSMSISLLMLSMYIPRVLHISTFPSILLFTTLFRLALNITSTRMILLTADAGEIIFTFGDFVVQGNFVVGAVIFGILLIVQFIVITKGAERVSEVSARFTLDAMPGKQMSIDADLRAGSIDTDQAKQKRTDLEQENQLYGAMDGAMKFVKGDTIASLIMTAINIIAGLVIGVFQKGMSVDKAIKTYAILTIGDGLVSTLPSLLISITAGVIVTRVSSSDAKPLGNDIGKQLLSRPKALVIAGIMSIGFMLIPGFPKVPFIVIGTLILLTGRSLMQTEGKPQGAGEIAKVAKNTGLPSDIAPNTPTFKEEKGEFSVTVPLLLDVATSIEESVDPMVLNDQLIQVRKALYFDLGVPFPGIHLRFNENLTDGMYQILLQEVPVSQGRILKGSVLVRETKESLGILNIPYQEEKAFLPNIPALWVSKDLIPQMDKASINYMTSPQILTYHLSFILKKYASEFIGLQETRFILENFEKNFPELVKEVQRVLPVQKIGEVLQRLVQEDVSIRNLRLIMQCLIDWGQKEKEPILLADYVRTSLKRYISYKYSGGQNILGVYLLDPVTEDIIRKSIRQTSAGSYLALEPNTAKKIVTTVKEEVGDFTQETNRPVLLTSMDIRRYVRKLIELELYELPVLSHQELTEEITIQPLGRIAVT
ncbi:MAG: type III secretion system export apparatus subunit SctV [Puniceicoccales bacterium]|jgi:type III secretion protein V|nr:type III secretion system export apparatus subunit SctV [Puniceicoccales bacterium]